jgi:hypothetical protein
MTMSLPPCRNASVFAQRRFWLVLIVSQAVALPCCSAQENCPAAAKENPPVSTPAVSNDTSKQLLAEFRRVYALPDDKAINRVAPPYSPGRMEYYCVRLASQAQYIPKPPDCLWFKWGDPTTAYDHTREGKLQRGGWFSDNSVGDLVSSSTGIHGYEMLGDKELIKRRISGDWVIRDGASPERLLPELETILRTECKVPVRFRMTRQDRKVIVAEGNYAYHPLPGRRTVVYKEGSEENNWHEGNFDELEVVERNRDGLTEEREGRFADLLEYVSHFINRPVLDEVSRQPKNALIFYYDGRAINSRRAHGALDGAAILKHLGEQTGLTFSERTRRVRVLLVERSE